MTLLVPDESLATVAEANAYHEGRGNVAAWAPLETENKEQLLRRAYDYLFAVYGSQWAADVAFGTAGGAIPASMVKASAILALKAKAGDLLPEAKAQKLRVKVGPIETEYAQSEAAPDGVRRFPEIDRLVGPFLAPAPSPYSIKLGRD